MYNVREDFERKMYMKKLLSIVLAIMLVVLPFALSGCGNKEDTTLNIGYFNNVTHSQALYMKAEQMLETNIDEMDVEWTAFNAGPAEVEALFSGSIDIGYIGPVPAISANVKSYGDVVILSSATKGGAVLITRKESNINSVSDLAGKKVAVPQIGNTQHLCLLDLLQKNGLKPDTDGGNVTVCAVSNADVANTINRGDIDAALVPEPWGATLLNDDTQLLLDYDQIYMNGDYDVAVVVVRKEFMEQYPHVVEAFLEQHNMVTDFINDNLDDALSIINQELHQATGKSLSEDVIQEAFTRIGVSTQLNKEAIKGFAEISKEQGFISQVPQDNELYSE